jgi:hypothetical protein
MPRGHKTHAEEAAKRTSNLSPVLSPDPAEMRTKEQIVKDYQGYLIRMLKTIGGFKTKHGHWPTRMRLPANAFKLLQNSALTTLGFQLLTAKLQLVAEEIGTLIAEDNNRLRLEYGEENPSEGDLFGGADEWIWGVKLN